MKASSRCRAKPEGAKPRRGSSADAANRGVGRDGSPTGSRPWSRRPPSWSTPRQRGGQAERRNGRRARTTDEVDRLGGGDKPLEGESRTWQRDETSPRGGRGSKPSRACETPRAERRSGVGPRPVVDLDHSCRDWDGNPMGGAPRIRARGRLVAVRTLKRRRSSGEDEPALARARGTTPEEVPPGRAGNRDVDVAADNPIRPQGRRSQHSVEQPTSGEVLASW